MIANLKAGIIYMLDSIHLEKIVASFIFAKALQTTS
jgi:hypothetical protein